MTDHAEILRGLYDETLVGNKPRVLELTNEGLASGLTPESMLFDALIPSLEEVGARFERGDFFVPEMLIAGRAMAGAMERLRPLLAETGVAAIEEHQPDIVGFSAFLTTTMPMFKANMNALEKAGIRNEVIVMVGGAPVTQEYADAVGADGYAADASQTVKRAKSLIEAKRTKVPA